MGNDENFNEDTNLNMIKGFAAPLEKDTTVYRITVIALGLIGLFTVVGGAVMSARGHELSSGIIALGGVAVGGLVGLLAPGVK